MKQVVCRIPRAEILEKMRREIAGSRPILLSGAGAGIVARIAEQSGVDMLVVYNSGYFRMNGHSSILGNLPVGDANQIVLEMGKKMILPVVSGTPVAAGVLGVDPTRDMERFLCELAEIGYSAVINYPTVGKFSGKFREEIESVGLGYEREAGMLKLAHDMGFLTIGYVYTEREARVMAQAGADLLAAHAGLTSGGDVGAQCASDLDDVIARTQRILTAGLDENPEIIPLCHGGTIESPSDFARVFHETCTCGFVGASSIERIPVERSVGQIIREFKSVRRNTPHAAP